MPDTRDYDGLDYIPTPPGKLIYDLQALHAEEKGIHSVCFFRLGVAAAVAIADVFGRLV